MRIVVVGAGAVGSLLGAMLARGGAEVAFVARGETRDRLRSVGVDAAGPDGALHQGPFEAEAEPDRVAPADAVFVSVKSFQLRALAPRLAPLLRPEGVIVSLLNGIDASDVLAEAIGDAPVLGGLCHVLASSTGPAQVAWKGLPLRVALGELAGGSSARVERLGEALRAGGVTVSIEPNIRVALWEKLLFVGPLGMVGAATSLPPSRTRELLEAAMHEVRRVAAARGVTVPEASVAAALARVDALPEGSRTSMHRDLDANRPSELGEQVGTIARLARELSVDAPIHRVLYAVLSARAGLPATPLLGSSELIFPARTPPFAATERSIRRLRARRTCLLSSGSGRRPSRPLRSAGARRSTASRGPRTSDIA